MHSPWGRVQSQRKVADGITFVTTASHGGFIVRPDINDKIPLALRRADGCYEEDCEYAKVVFSFPRHFSEKQIDTAKRTLAEYFPDAYEELTGEIIPEGQSYAKDKRSFTERHKNDLVVISAMSKGEGIVKVCAVPGGRVENFQYRVEEERWFFVPQEEYDKRNKFGFIVDPKRHQETQPGFYV